MTDIHCHILPGIDDGPKSWEESLELCRALVAEGVTTAVATPHIIDDVYRNTRDSVAAGVAELTRRLTDAEIPLHVLPGGEVAMTFTHLTQPPHDRVPTLNGSRYVLIELPSAVLPQAIPNLFFTLTSRGIIPVIAHPERNRALQEDPALGEQWAATGCYFQIDAESVLGLWGRPSARCARRLVETGLAHALASDAHSCDRRPPRLRMARDKVTEWAGGKMVAYLVTDGPSRLVADLPPGEPPPRAAEHHPRTWQTWRQRLGLAR